MNYKRLPFALQFIGVIFLSIVAVTVIDNVVDRIIRVQERHECLTWQQQGQEYADWYAASWQVEQCAAYNIAIK